VKREIGCERGRERERWRSRESGYSERRRRGMSILRSFLKSSGVLVSGLCHRFLRIKIFFYF